MLSLMTSVYNALRAHLACTVTRAFPKWQPVTPSLSFRLADFSHQLDGSDIAAFEVFIRCVSPEQGDVLANQAQAAFASLQFNLSAASDEIEEETGVFLKRLRFSTIVLVEEVEDVQVAQVAPLLLRVNIDVNALLVGGQLTFEIITDSRKLIDNNAISHPNFRYSPGGFVPGGLVVKGDYVAANPGQLHIKNSFLAGSSVKASLSRASFILPFNAWVTECSHTPLGFFAVFKNIL